MPRHRHVNECFRSFVASGLAALVLGGCGSPSSPATTVTVAGSTSVAPSSAPTPTPSPTVWSKAEAGERYLAMVQPINAAITAMGATFDVNEDTWRGIRSDCSTIVKANDTFMRALSDGLWDPATRPAVDAVITSSSAAHSWYVKCAAAKDLDEIDVLGDVTQQDPGSPQRLRVALGLPSVSG